jgi:hypothetical protein
VNLAEGLLQSSDLGDYLLEAVLAEEAMLAPTPLLSLAVHVPALREECAHEAARSLPADSLQLRQRR